MPPGACGLHKHTHRLEHCMPEASTQALLFDVRVRITFRMFDVRPICPGARQHRRRHPSKISQCNQMYQHVATMCKKILFWSSGPLRSLCRVVRDNYILGRPATSAKNKIQTKLRSATLFAIMSLLCATKLCFGVATWFGACPVLDACHLFAHPAISTGSACQNKLHIALMCMQRKEVGF